ncbi:Hypothetical predicted protein [Lecanosticta acicola]|uniref:MYND-type domain-containing protein n=1 Tax=Lecanosticta acicola TaxID=111012 RepID=A0AAI8YZQ2_9PEZI|nr:Hypothetical predicted protein [Lecanosticta acicola]
MAGDAVSDRQCTSCHAEGKITCQSCKLVLYCSAKCAKHHAAKHRRDCKSPLMKPNWKPSWEMEKRTPAFIGDGPPQVAFGGKKYFWGNVPAIDILNLPANEGEDHEKELRLLFAASGDWRNIVKTIASLPVGYDKQLSVFVNDLDFDVVARNIIFVLIALTFDKTTDAVECMLHVWYSATIRQSDFDILINQVRPLIETVVDKIAGKASNQVLGKTWTFGANSCRVELPKCLWDQLLAYFEVPKGLTAEGAYKIRKDVTLARERVDYRDRHMLLQIPAHRVGMSKFREDGILLPLGNSREKFTVPNPTFFQGADWPMKDSSDPMEGWHYPDVVKVDCGPATNDLYGKLYYHVKHVLTSFRSRLAAPGCKFHMLNMNAAELPQHLAGKDFARIETSNIADRAYLGTARTVGLLGPLLQKPADNPYATLITSYMNAVEEVCLQDGKTSQTDIAKVFQYLPRPTDLMGMMAAMTTTTHGSNAWMIAALASLHCVRDVEGHFGS